MQEKINYSYALPSFSSCWKRLTEKTNIRNQSQLAKIVGKTEAYISKMKKQDIFLPEWAYYVSLEYDVSMDWILTGKIREIRRSEENNRSYAFSILKELEEWLESLTTKEPKRVDWFSISIQDSFPMFREWKKRREKEESGSDIDSQSNVA